MITLVLFEEEGMGSIGGRGGTRERESIRGMKKENSMKRGDRTVGMRHAGRGRARE